MIPLIFTVEKPKHKPDIKDLNRIKNESYLYKNLSFKNIISPIVDFFHKNKLVTYSFFKYDPYFNNVPYVQTWYLPKNQVPSMMLDSIFLFKNKEDNSYAFRRSCREGICGSCAMNINGMNTLACIHKNLNVIHNYIYPLPHMPIIKDLVVCMKHFYEQYRSINPFLKTHSLLFLNSSLLFHLKSNCNYLNSYNLTFNIIPSFTENNQSILHRKLLDGLYECILCACCSTSCPSYWWNRDKYLGPAVLLQSYRWLIDTRDDSFFDRLSSLNDYYKLFRCHTILNCSETCPKGLSPASAISNIKLLTTIHN